LHDPKEVRVGDTVTELARATDKPLEGYRQLKPLVFCGVYPVNAGDYAPLREAIDKLRLSDPSFVYEHESSLSFGHGFRCGFLGLLHMEIVQERLEREYDLNLILTTPNVGYHIIKLIDVAGQGQDFETLKPQIRAELMYQKALAKFSEQAEAFSATVYEQSNSLQPAADAYGLAVQKTEWLSFADGAKFFKNDKLMNLVFTNEVLKDKRNTEAVEVSNNTLVSARVVDYKPSAPRSFDEVKGGIEDLLKIEKATKLAIDKGTTSLASLKEGKEAAGLDWIAPVTVDRKNAQGLTDLTMSNVFKIDTTKLPAYAGISDSKKGYLLIKVTAVQNKLADDEAKKAALLDLRTAMASEYSSAYIGSLKANKKIFVNTRLMMSDSAQGQ
jgi:peptidyl-prolyl cis-trans isomerase D